MIQRTRVAEPSEPESPTGPSDLVELTDVDFSFAADDMCSFTLTADDRLVISDSAFTITLAGNGEQIWIDRSKVRWWSKRTREVAVQRQLADPDPAHAAN